MEPAAIPRLVERLLVHAGPPTRPDDETITETDGEADSWRLEYPPETITKDDGESDTWMTTMMSGSDPGDETITREDGESDSWTVRGEAPPTPQPPDDVITLDDGEGDSWS